MTETRAIAACAECEVFWFVAGEAPGCTDASHEHQTFAVHHHRALVVLPDGTPIAAVSFDAADPYTRDARPDFGLYFDARWHPPWPHVLVDWPDFGVPDDPTAIVTVLRALLERARTGQRVEIGCLGGHGRTGTALAGLAVLSGMPAKEAGAWVRTTYCDQAIETREQETFVAALGSR